MAIELAPGREQTRARYPDESGYVERDGVRVFFEVYGTGRADRPPAADVVDHPLAAVEGADPVPGARTSASSRSTGAATAAPTARRSRRPTTSGSSPRTRSPCWTRPRPRAPSIVGYSLGAQRGLILAADHPERVDGRRLHRPGLRGRRQAARRARRFTWEDEHDTDEGWAKYNKHFWLRDYRGFVEFFFSQICSASRTRRSRSRTASAGARDDPGDADRGPVRRSCSAPEEARKLARDAALPAPRRSTDDRTRSRHYTRGEALAQHAGGELVLLEGGGHAPHARDPVMFNLLAARVRGAAARDRRSSATREQSRARYPDEEGFVERDGVRVFYEVYGDAPTTFLLFPTVADLALAALEGADPVPLAPLPRRHVRPARQRPLRPPERRRGVLAGGSSSATAAPCWRRRGADAALARRALRRRRLGAHARRDASRRRRSASPRSRRSCLGLTPSHPNYTPVPVRRAARHRRGLGEVQRPLLAPRLPAASSSSSSRSRSRSRTRRSRSRTASAGGSRAARSR